MSKDNRFGINMKRWCREHEAEVTAALEGGTVTCELAEEHLLKIAWLQHERLVHLIVTALVAVCELFFVGLSILHPELGLLPPVIVLILAVLLGFYFYHYFVLENTVQRWYIIADQLKKRDQKRIDAKEPE